MGKILVVGSLNMDFVINTNKMPVPGETVLGNNFTLSPGGKGANQAYAIGKIGGDVSMIGAVGDDANGEKLKANLQSVGVNTSTIVTLGSIPTGCAFVTVDETGENSIVVIQGSNKMLIVDHIKQFASKVQEADIVLLQLEIPIEVVKYTIQLAKQYGKIVIVDPAPAQADVLTDVFPLIDFAKPNETELSILTGMPTDTDEQIIAAARKLNAQGLQNVIVTLGKRGAFWVTKENFMHFPVPQVPIVDTTAAGDSFIATFAISLAEHKSIPESIEFASKVANLVVTRRGAQSSIPTKEEVENL